MTIGINMSMALARAMRVTPPLPQPGDLVAYWPLDEAGGSTAKDVSGHGLDGTYSNVTLGAEGTGDGRTAAGFNATSSSVNLSAALAAISAALTGGEWSILLWIETDAWGDTAFRWAFGSRADADNRLDIYKPDTTNVMYTELHAGGTTQFVATTLPSALETWIPVVVTFNKAADRMLMYHHGIQDADHTMTLGTWSGTLIGAKLGATYNAGAGFWDGSLANSAVWGSELSSADVAVASRNAGQIIIEGDSRSKYTYGVKLTQTPQIADLNFAMRSYAVAGQAVYQMVADAATEIDTLFRVTIRENIVIVWGGVNDAALSISAATIWASLQEYCTDRRLAGFTVFLCTEVDAQDSARNLVNWSSTVYPALNVLIRAGWEDVADGLIDLGADFRLQDATDTTYFLVDQVHLSSTGYDVVAQLAAPQIAYNRAESYIDQNLAFLPIAYWPFNEASGTNAFDASGNDYDGTYSTVALGASGIGDGETAATFNGTSSYANVYSAGFAGDFDGQEGTFECWVKVRAAGVWSDGTVRIIARFMVGDGLNYLQVQKDTSTGVLKFEYAANNVYKTRFSAVQSSIGYIHLAATWSKSADQVHFYIDGVQEGATLTGLGTFAGSLDSSLCVIGNGAVGGTSNVWDGSIAHPRVFDRALSAHEIAQRASL